MNPDEGIYRMARYMGRMAGEKDIVGTYFKRRRNAQGTGGDFYLPENTKEYIPMRNEALTDLYGKGFVEQEKYGNFL